jgi:D-glycerate 3-kinase
MTDEEVTSFVNNYMPAYELYLGQLRTGTDSAVDAQHRKQLRLVINQRRDLIHYDWDRVVQE